MAGIMSNRVKPRALDEGFDIAVLPIQLLKSPRAAFESGSLKRTLADRANRTLASVAGHTSIVRGGLLPTEPQRRRWTLSSGVPMSSPADAKSFQSFTIIPQFQQSSL